MNVYIIAAHNGKELEFYVLDEEAWNTLDEDEELYTALFKVDHLASCSSLAVLFKLVDQHGWNVSGSDHCPIF